MLTAEAKRLEASSGKQVVVGQREWSPAWENNPVFATPDYKGPTVKLTTNRLGKRPYIAGCDGVRIIYNESFRPEPGEIYLSTGERIKGDLRKGLILVEPTVKGTFSGNKAWFWGRWQAVSDALGATQMVPPDKRRLNGGRTIETPKFRDALAYLSRAKLLITTDGALHHAAAAMGVPAVVLWGARTHPSILGYPRQENIYTGQGESCGMMVPCAHCVEAMERVTVDMVIDAAHRLLD